uniref:PLAC8 protein n=1 Tax=Sinocyclocheilus anshuiensis TaxID=1608454 RepID=A0A671T0G1_9TELE
VMPYQTEVMTSQPQMTVTSYTVSHWSSDVCDCCDDCGICLCGAFIPCILGCKVAQDNGDSCCLPFLPGAMIALRTSIHDKYQCRPYWVIMTCCPFWGLCQMAREQKARG